MLVWAPFSLQNRTKVLVQKNIHCDESVRSRPVGLPVPEARDTQHFGSMPLLCAQRPSELVFKSQMELLAVTTAQRNEYL